MTKYAIILSDIQTQCLIHVHREIYMSRIKLSIIVPCYKVEQYLPRCLDSLVNQTLDDIEIICINDGSPDNCLDILKEYRNRYGDKICIIDKKNEGVWKGRRDGIARASGEYIGFVDSDDYVREDYAEKLYNAALTQNADISCCGFDRIDMETGKLYSREMTKFKHASFDIQSNPGLLLEVNAAPWNKIFRSGLLKNMAELEHIPKALDDMMFAQLIYINAGKIVFINESLIYYMIRSDSIINTIKPELIPGIYTSMKDVRKLYEISNPDMLEYMDALAFLHIGISFMYRLSANKDIDFNTVLKNNTDYLDSEFPGWRNNRFITLRFVLRNRGTNLKLLIVRWFCRMHMFRLFLALYRFMIDRLKIDIKW